MRRENGPNPEESAENKSKRLSAIYGSVLQSELEEVSPRAAELEKRTRPEAPIQRMPQPPLPPRTRSFWGSTSQPARICFVVALVAFSAAGAGWMVNHFLTGWMEVAGMLAVGLFYLSLGVLELGRKPNR